MFKNRIFILTAVIILNYFFASLALAQGWSGRDLGQNRKSLDYDNPRKAFSKLGCQIADYDQDRLVYHIDREQGAFQTLRFKIDSNRPYFMYVKVITTDGQRHKFNISSEKSFPGQAIQVRFSYVPKKVKKVIVKYDAKMDFSDRVKICLLGDTPKNKRFEFENPLARQERPSFQRQNKGWNELGCVKANKTYQDSYIHLGKGRGFFEAIRFYIKNAPAMIDDVLISFKNGSEKSLNVHGLFSEGQYSKIYRNRPNRSISVIDIRSRSRSMFRKSHICFQGLAYEAMAQKNNNSNKRDTDSYADGNNDLSKSEVDQLEHEQTLRKNRRFAQKERQARKPHVKRPVEGQDEKTDKPYAQDGELESEELDSYISGLKKNKRRQAKEQEQATHEKKMLAEKRAQKRLMEKDLTEKRLAEKQIIIEQEKATALRKKIIEEKVARQKRQAKQKKQAEAEARRQAKKQTAPEVPKTDERNAEEEVTQKRVEAELAEREKAKRLEQEKVRGQQEQAEKLKAEKQAEQQRHLAQEQRKLDEARQEQQRQRQEKADALKRAADAKAKAKAEVEAKAKRLAQLKAQSARNFVEKLKIHSKKADFPKKKVSPGQTGWISYGCQEFGTTIEERYIPVGRMQGTFTAIRVRVLQNSLTLKKMIVVYGNGKQEPLIRYSSRIKIGERTSDYKLSHRRRFISEVKLKAQARDFRNENKAQVCLEAYR